jgi:hypothetical protein
MEQPGTVTCDTAQGGKRSACRVARLVFIAALTSPEVVMMEGPMPIRIRHRHKKSVTPQQSDISLVISQGSYTALVAKSRMICGSV